MSSLLPFTGHSVYRNLSSRLSRARHISKGCRDSKKVGSLIRRLRSRPEITQATLASLTGIHRTYLSRAERGQVMPSIIALMQIARALKDDKVMLRVRK